MSETVRDLLKPLQNSGVINFNSIKQLSPSLAAELGRAIEVVNDKLGYKAVTTDGVVVLSNEGGINVRLLKKDCEKANDKAACQSRNAAWGIGFDAMVKSLDRDEFAGALEHEIGHLALKHHTQPNENLSLAQQRDKEYQADAMANNKHMMAMLLRACQDYPSDYNVDSSSNDHPNHRDRLQRVITTIYSENDISKSNSVEKQVAATLQYLDTLQKNGLDNSEKEKFKQYVNETANQFKHVTQDRGHADANSYVSALQQSLIEIQKADLSRTAKEIVTNQLLAQLQPENSYSR